jgi:hypothetical protein
MTRARKRAEQAFAKAGDARTGTAKRDMAFLDQRRATEAANLKRTLELRALRLAHEAANPRPKPGARRKPVLVKSE